MSRTEPSARRTYFGLASLIVAVISTLLLVAFIGISQMNITAEAFSLWNNILATLLCSIAPLALILGGIGLLQKSDSRALSWIAILLVGVPFLIMFTRMVMSLSFIR